MSAKPRVDAVRATVVALAGILAFALVALASLGGAEAARQQLSCGDTITADTTLDGDLLGCPNNGIIIGADDITLDLNGHTLAGDGELMEPCPEDEFCDTGVANDGHDGVTIKDGTVTDFGFGVFVFKVRHNRLRDLAAVDNTFEGILVVRSARTRVQESSASRNGVGNTRPGIALIESDNNRIAGNTMSGNGDLALFMAASDDNLIRHNKTRGHPEGGMIIEGDRNEIVRNRSLRDGGGILITIVNRGGKAVGNLVSRNEVRNARQAGIALDPVPKRTVIRRNHVVGSGRAGISVGSRSTKLTKNRAVRNDGLGIKAVKGVTDGGGNIARRNGDPRQCVNVKCH